MLPRQQIRSADIGNGLDHWGYLRKEGGECGGREDGEDQEVSTNRSVGMLTATVQPRAHVCVFSVF